MTHLQTTAAVAAAGLTAEDLSALFTAQGALPLEVEALQPAGTLLDLYGEDLRARAYVTQDPARGELMLRPDFTVPVVQYHMEHGGEPARYTYRGTVFRKQEPGSGRASEYEQVGYEIFDRANPAKVEAELFALIEAALRPYGLRAATGDFGILRAAVQALDTSERRKAALLRHLWRPRRFRALLDRFRGRVPQPSHRAELAALDPAAAEAVIADSGPQIGLRSADEIAARIAVLRDEASQAPLPDLQADVLDDILSLRAPCRDALTRLRDFAVDVPGLDPALDGFADRLSALEAAGIDTSVLEFEASYGRTAMEYYDGFVFGFYAPDRPELPPVATGGRYDALTRALGAGREIPALGAVVRPGLLALLPASTIAEGG